jgi:cysteine synthase A
MQHYPDAFWPHQYENPDNPRAYTELAYELLDDLQRIDILVGAVGSGGSLCGTAQALHQLQHHVRVVGVDAVGSVIFGQPDRPGRLQGGLGNSLIPPNVDHHIVDEVHWLSDAEAFTATLELARDEKIFAGNSSGSVYAVARWISRHVQPDTQIVAIFPDRGDRYFSTIYNAEYRATKGIAVAPLPAAPQRVDYGTTVETWSYAFNEWSMPMIERHSHAKRALVH